MLRRIIQLTAAAALLGGCDDSFSSGIINVAPPPSHIAFLTQPTNVGANAAISPAVRIGVQNPNGQTVGSGTFSVTITLVAGTGSPGASLVGGAVQQTTGGIVNFTNLRIDTPGTGYQLLASATGFPSIASTPFDVTP
jgi:hypothetical protein